MRPAKTQSLLLPVGWTPWVAAVLGFGSGANEAAQIVKSTGIYGTMPGDLMIIQSGLISAAIWVGVFVGARAIWRLMHRRGSWNTLGIGIACAVIAFALIFYQRWPQIASEPWGYRVGLVLGASLFGGIGAAISAIRTRIKRAT